MPTFERSDIVSLPAHGARAGLSIASMIRTAKIATAEAREARRIGRPSAAEIRAVRTALGQIVG